jgi:hypothetical protein
MFLVDPGMGDWGYRVAPVGEKSVRTISVPSVLNDAACADTIPLLIKIDIEGGEQFLFASNTDWLGLFPLIIIELHDWMLPWSGNSRNFFRRIAEYEFDVVHRGENLFLFNRSILS